VQFISPSRTIQIAIAVAINSEFKLLLDPKEIALEICYPKYGVHYTSAIALAISHRLGIETMEIAEAIAKTCSQNPEIATQFQIKAFGKGWLNIFLSEQYLFENLLTLEHLQVDGMHNCDGFWQKCSISTVNNSPEPILQYTYARCCALIRHAQRENLCVSKPEIIPSMEPVEISLLMQNLAIADYLENANILLLNRQKLLRSLAEAFLQFYDRCRIFGVPLEIAFWRLTLIRITQKLLLAISPPEINYAMYL
jgi:arginyl-tRNA synthetase